MKTLADELFGEFREHSVSEFFPIKYAIPNTVVKILSVTPLTNPLKWLKIMEILELGS